MMALPSPAIVGRASELARLEQLVDGISSDRAVLLEVSGPAGIGKTTMLDHLAFIARAQGIRCCRATATPAEQDRPFGVVVALFDALLSLGDPRIDPAASLGSHEFADLAEALPSLRRSASLGSAGRADPLLVARALRATLASGVKVGSPGDGTATAMAVLVDDIQCADEASAVVLANVIRNGIGAPLIVALARRAGFAFPPALSAPNLSPAQPTVIDLKPLARDESLALLRDLPVQQREDIDEIAGGNPFFLKELAAAARIGQLALPDRGEGIDGASYPASVVARIEIQLDGLSPPARDLARAASILGDPFETSFVGELAGLDPAGTAAAIDELAEVGLIAPGAGPGLFRFGHPIVGSVIHDTSGPGWRRHAHERAHRLLTDAGADQVRAAGHLERSAPPGDATAAEALAAAARGARTLAPATAARLFSSAIRILPRGPGQTDMRATWEGCRADALIGAGEVDHARAELEQTLASGAFVSPLSRAALIGHLVRAQLWLGLDVEAEERLNAAIADLAPGPSAERLMLAGLAMLTAAGSGHVDRVVELDAVLADLVASSVSPLDRFSVAAARAMAMATTGPGSAAVVHQREAGELLGTLSEVERAMACETVSLLATAEVWLGLASDALVHTQLAETVARESRNRMVELVLKMNGAAALLTLGQLDDADRAQREAEDLARLVGQANAICPAVAVRSAVAYFRGDLRRAEEAIDECVSLLPLAGGRAARTVSATFLARPLIAVGRPGVAMRLLLEHGGGSELPFLAHAVRSPCFEVLVEAALAEGDVVEGRRWVGQAESSSDPDLPVTVVAALLATAELGLAEGRHDVASATAMRAAAEADRAAAPMDAARARFLAGRARALGGDRDSAVAMFEEAYAMFRKVGANGLAAETARGLRELGVRARVRRASPRPGSSDRIDFLSVRELEIAELVAEGLGNREIARQVFLSPRTVESHLSRILRKLGVRSRKEVRQAVRARQYRAAMDPDPE